jgi:DNA processing protein
VKEADEAKAFLALCTIRGIGYSTLARMAKAGVSFAAFLRNSDVKAISHELRKFGSFHESETKSDWQEVRARAIDHGHRLEDNLNAIGARLIISGTNGFPPSLTELSNSPAWLFVRGNASLLCAPSIAVVGARKLSEDGKWLCKFIGLCFNGWKVPIITGMASELDYGVHELSLRAGVPTIAVQGAGMLSESRSVFRESIISEGGAIVTEYLPHDGYSPDHFERLGRVQAALSRVLIPIECRGKENGSRAVYHAGCLRRPIAAIRLSDWPVHHLPPSDEAIQSGDIFTIPGQEEEFRMFVARSMDEANPVRHPEPIRNRHPEPIRKERALIPPHPHPRLRLARGRPPRSPPKVEPL